MGYLSFRTRFPAYLETKTVCVSVRMADLGIG